MIPVSHRRFVSILFILSLLALLSATPGALAQGTVTVTNTNSSGAGSLRAALNTVPTGGTVNFAAGLNNQTITITSNPVPIRSDCHIDASSLPGQITIAGSLAESPIDDPDNVEITNVHFTGVSSGAVIGGFFNLTLTDCSFISNNCDHLVHIQAGEELSYDLTIEDCVAENNDLLQWAFEVEVSSTIHLADCQVRSNSANILRSIDGDLTVERCDFTANSGLVISKFGPGNATIRECTFHDNLTGGENGRVVQITNGLPTVGSVEVVRSTFSNNHGLALGVFVNTPGSARIANCTFSGNEGVPRMAGPDSSGTSVLRLTGNADVQFDHCTVYDNTGADFGAAGGAAIFMLNGQLRPSHCIFANNDDGTGATDHAEGMVFSDGYNLLDNNEGEFTNVNDIKNTDPALLPLSDNGGPTKTHLPALTSPALDAGNPAAVAGAGGVPLTDQRGFPRVQDSDGNGTPRISIGAVETPAANIVTTAIDEITNPATVSLREAIGSVTPGNTTIGFHPTLNGATIDLTFAGSGQGTPLVATTDLTIDASNLSNGITIDGGDAVEILQILPGGRNVSINKVNFVDGNRAIVVQNVSTLSVSNARFTSCFNGSGGGAIRAMGFSGLTLNNCLLTDCRANTSGGGAVFAEADSNVVINRCLFQDNEAAGGWGGAVHCGGASLEISRSCFFRNSAFTTGGALNINADCTTSISRSSIVKNRAGTNGGAIRFAQSGSKVAATFFRTTIGENHCGNANGGGAVSWQAGSRDATTFTHCTIYRNSGGGAFGGSMNEVFFSHTIVAENRDNTGFAFNTGTGTPVSLGSNLVDLTDVFPLTFPLTDLLGQPARLSPIGWHGGRCPTYHPLAFSPAIDGGNPATGIFILDARDFFFTRDGDSNGSVVVDIGAVEAFTPVYVNTSIDESNGPTGGAGRSLREAIANAGNGSRILFDPTLNGAVSSLTLNAIGFSGKALVVDATTLPDGFTLDAGGSSRCLRVETGAGLSMHAVSLRNGIVDGSGGAILNQNICTISRAAVHNNDAINSGSGGAIQHAGQLLIVEHCTLSNNNCDLAGGAINVASGGDFCIAHCTIADNDSDLGAAAQSGGIQVSSGTGEITHTILANNTGNNGSTPRNYAGPAASLISRGYNLESGTDAGFTATGDQQSTDPILMALQDDGGYSQVRPTKGPGQNAGDPSFPAPELDDQRGYVRVFGAAIDIGAYEFGAVPIPDFDGDCMTNSFETLNGFDPLDPADADLDEDGDGQSNVAEAKAMTDPGDPDSRLSIVLFGTTAGSNSANLTFSSVPGKLYDIFYSTDLVSWHYVQSTPAAASPFLITTANLIDSGTPTWSAFPEVFFIVTVAP